MTTFVLTAHHRDDRWAPIQRRFLDAWMGEPFELVACVEGVAAETLRHFDRHIDGVGAHAGKLNLLAHVVGREAKAADVLIFLDSDAFPIAPLMPLVRESLTSASFVAVQRLENLGDPQPHPCFAACTVETWQRIRGDWSSGDVWTNLQGEVISDVGANLLRLLEDGEVHWRRLNRTHSLDRHPVLFGVYGGAVYHHGAGSRSGLTRAGLAEIRFRPEPSQRLPKRVLTRVQRRSAIRSESGRLSRVSEEWYRVLEAADPSRLPADLRLSDLPS